MAARSKDIEANLAPGDEPVRADYERDFYSWSLEQAQLIREGRIEALDRDNLAEEIEIFGARAVQQARRRFARGDAAHAEVGSPASQAITQLDALDQTGALGNS